MRAFLLAVSLVVPLQAAESPTFIPFQGRITDQSGNTYTNGQYTILFQIYNQAVGGQAIWQERHDKVGVVNGLVNVFLGSINPLPNDFSTTKHLGITIDADNNPNTPEPEMIPRQMIIPAYWAKNSEKLAGHDWTPIFGSNSPVGPIPGGKIQNNSINTQQIASGAITSNHLAAGAVNGAAIASGTITSNQIAAGSISGVNLGFASVTLSNLAPRPVGTNVGSGGVAVSSSTGNYLLFPPSVNWTVVDPLTVTIETTGRPVLILFVSTTNHADASYFETHKSGGPVDLYVAAFRDSTGIGNEYAHDANSAGNLVVSPGAFRFLDTPPAGTHTYTIGVRAESGTQSLRIYKVRLVVFEL